VITSIAGLSADSAGVAVIAITPAIAAAAVPADKIIFIFFIGYILPDIYFWYTLFQMHLKLTAFLANLASPSMEFISKLSLW
jgi:hypothetical protein